MVAFDGSEPCAGAEAYYHDYLGNENDPSIPPAVADHIRQCQHCQRRLSRLRAMLSEAGSSDAEASVPRREDAMLVAELQSHFELMDEPLGCARVKPFLPSLLVPSLKIRVPTPVTVHVDQCPDCARDLESLRALDLNGEQLDRLCRLYAEGSNSGFWTCLRTLSKIAVIRPGGLERVDAETLDHLCVCPRCRNWLYQQRQRLLERERGQSVCCADIAVADLFDFVVPYGKPVGLMKDQRSRQCGEHLRSCRECLERAQQLHRTIYGILERCDSEVLTVFSTQASGQADAEVVDPLYEAYPVDVRVLDREPEVVGAPLGRRLSVRFRPVFKPALMMAALIPLAIVFFWGVRSASGLNPAQVEQVVREASCVHISVFGEDLDVPRRQMWASKRERLLITETVRGPKVFDLTQGTASIVKTDNTVETEPADVAAVDQHMNSLLGFSLGQLLAGRELVKLEDVAVLGKRLEVYELRWQNPTAGRWKVYIDPETGRPVETELFTWDRFEATWTRDETRRFEYPSDEAVRRRADEILARQ